MQEKRKKNIDFKKTISKAGTDGAAKGEQKGKYMNIRAKFTVKKLPFPSRDIDNLFYSVIAVNCSL
jgi:hypothetical protein